MLLSSCVSNEGEVYLHGHCSVYGVCQLQDTLWPKDGICQVYITFPLYGISCICWIGQAKHSSRVSSMFVAHTLCEVCVCFIFASWYSLYSLWDSILIVHPFRFWWTFDDRRHIYLYLLYYHHQIWNFSGNPKRLIFNVWLMTWPQK